MIKKPRKFTKKTQQKTKNPTSKTYVLKNKSELNIMTPNFFVEYISHLLDIQYFIVHISS
jgi:hypothetical protein